MIIQREQFDLYTSPAVYIFWKDTLCLYVGESKNVLNRATNANHSAKQHEIFGQFTHVEIRPCASKEEAQYLETELIMELDPILNIRGRRIIRKSAGYGKAYNAHERQQKDINEFTPA